MILLFILSILVLLFIAYLLNSWVQVHAIAVLIDGTWTMQAKGWSALLPQISAGLLAGLGVGFCIGILLANELAKFLQNRKNDSLADAQNALDNQRIALAKERASIDAHVQKVTSERVSAIKKNNDALTLENDTLKRDLIAQKNKLGIIEGRLKGAQQKNARLKKQV